MIQPLYLFSDSQLLFWKDRGQFFATHLLPPGKPVADVAAAYIGASNGDDPVYFEIFKQAMGLIGVQFCRMIPSKLKRIDLEFLQKADVILLAGGDVKVGWDVINKNGVAMIIRNRYEEGATLAGISAGAIQLGLLGNEHGQFYKTFQFVPFLIDVHDEANDWRRLYDHVVLHPQLNAYGIPFGAAMVYYPDGKIRAIRKNLLRLQMSANNIRKSWVLAEG